MSVVVQEALTKLGTALHLLEVTVSRRLQAEHRRGDLETELQIMQDDRARLALDLESTAARLEQVETVAEHVERRVETAIGTIEHVLSGVPRSED